MKQKGLNAVFCLLLAAALLVSIAAGPLATRVRAATSGEIRSQIDALEEQQRTLQARIEELERQIDENFSEMQQIVVQKNRIDEQIFLLNSQIDNLNEQIAAYAVLIADKQEELDRAERRLADLNEKNRERIRSMEENRGVSYWAVLFKANSFAEFLDRLSMIREIAAADQRRLDMLRDAAHTVSEARQALETERTNLESARAELDASQASLEEKRAQADTLLREMQLRDEEYQRYLRESADREAELAQQIADKETEFDRAAYQEWLATSVPETTKAPGGDGTGAGNPGGSSAWRYPLPYVVRVTDPFGWRDQHPVYGGGRMHNGVDLGAPYGTPIYASRSGVVTVASYQAGGAGNYVSINHGDGYSSIYMHMSYYIVSPGQYVSAGQTIGYVGDTGGVTGAHLHFGIAYNGVYRNPMEFIG